MALKLLNPSLRPLGQFDLEDDDTLVGGECVALEGSAASGDNAASDTNKVGPFIGTAATSSARFSLGEFEKGKLCGLADEGSTGYGTQFGHLIGTNTGLGVQVPLNTGATLAGGAVVVGPATNKASGKVTVWHAPGLYAVNGDALASSTEVPTALNVSSADSGGTVDALIDIGDVAAELVINADTKVNHPVFAAANGKLHTAHTHDLDRTAYYMNGGISNAGKSDQLGIYCGYLKDSSLISTPLNLAAQGSPSGSGDRDYGSAYSAEAEEFVIYFLGNSGLY